MSTTLTNGLKLPDKGSVDWYADMQSNYTILDGAVGTVAEHTTQIAGKAPLVHTHTKSDITDLFNSDNTWSGNNTYTATINYQSSYTLGNPPQSVASQIVVKVADAAGSNYLAQVATYQDTALSGLRFTIRDKFDSNGFSPSGSNRNKYLSFLQNTSNQGYLQWDGYANNSLIPLANATYDLGSSSYQWNNLYAKNYYYNGTAWGLDQANVWTNRNILEAWGFTIRENSITDTTAPSSDVGRALIEVWGGDFKYWGGYGYRWRANGNSELLISLSNWNGNTQGYWEYTIGVNKAFNNLYFNPPNGISDLGTSDHKWKTLNGVNPGALSLPDMDSTVSKTTELVAAIDKTQTANSWTANFTGILRITWYVKNLTGPFRCAVFNYADIRYATWGQTFSANDVWFFIISFPVQNGKTYYFDNSFTRTSEDTAPIVYGASAVYCLGNV